MNDYELLDSVWKALVEHGSSKKSEEAVKRYWATLSPKQKLTAANIIPRKVKEGKFVQYDPIRAIKENIRSYQMPEPEFLRGDEGGDLVQVRYNGLYKICTRETMEMYHLEYVKNWN